MPRNFMSYFPSDPGGLGEFGCGPSCACSACKRRSGFGQTYVEDEEMEVPTSPPPRPPRRRVRLRPQLGEAPLPRLVPSGPQLRMRPFHVIAGFPPHDGRLRRSQILSIQQLAQSLDTLWGPSGQRLDIQVVGHIDADESRSDLGLERAHGVSAALSTELDRLNPRLRARIQFATHDCGFTPGGRAVNVFVWVNLGRPAPPPCAMRIPSPAEVARPMVPPPHPETPDERIRRILTSLHPAPAPGRTFSQTFWQWVDRNLDSAMSRAGIPQSLRGSLRDGAHEAIKRGAEAIFDQVLDAAELTGGPRQAVKSVVRAALQQPVR